MMAATARPSVNAGQREGPHAGALWAKEWRAVQTAESVRANLPRSALTKRLCVPLVVISRAMAEYNVAAGVLPPGEFQYPFAAIASIISLQPAVRLRSEGFSGKG
jgi:hypothetical protein